MICEKCDFLFCRCFIDAYKRQPVGTEYKLLVDDNAPHSDGEARRRETRRLYNQKFREEKKLAKKEKR